jgi:hypothetical protein
VNGKQWRTIFALAAQSGGKYVIVTAFKKLYQNILI